MPFLSVFSQENKLTFFEGLFDILEVKILTMGIDERMEQLKERRKALKWTQEKLASDAGISRQYLSGLEAGRYPLTDEVYKKLMSTVEGGLNLVIDYVRVRFRTMDYGYIIEDILGLKMDYMVYEDYGWYGYSSHYEYGDIFVLMSVDKEKGTLFEIKGQGCRQFEGVLQAQKRTWYDFFFACVQENAVFKRVDLAVNDMLGILDVRQLAKKCSDHECVSKFRGYKTYLSGELVPREEKVGMGYTLYIGSVHSDIYFCIYQKDYEQYVKRGIPVDEVPILNRFEVRLMNDRGRHAVDDLLEWRDGEKTVFGIINQYVRFVDRDEKKDRSDWEVNDRWAWFLGENRRRLKLTAEPKPYSLIDTYNWLSRQVAPTLKMVSIVDDENGTTILQDMVERAELSERQKHILKQCTTKVEDIIR